MFNYDREREMSSRIYVGATCITQTVSIVIVVDGGDNNTKGHYVEMYRQTKQLYLTQNPK